MKILMRNVGMTLYTIQKIKDAGVDTSGLSVNMDFQHLIMNGEPLAEYASLLMTEGKLGHLHANSGWGTFDDDNMTGSLNFMETIAIAKELQRGGYGTKASESATTSTLTLKTRRGSHPKRSPVGIPVATWPIPSTTPSSTQRAQSATRSDVIAWSTRPWEWTRRRWTGGLGRNRLSHLAFYI